ncbi:DUF2490 domain-containing protein [Flavobacterium sp. '19STA2R22 D10 B1']|uniref:DUF2490 domain-containing protein n=1 Tax=Flavobacterium aerium TaxID=3037261 RepID=UPI00278BD25A|nr:DUF2490 domain-containing protein [Flavobacterium sp. '19STA2R22 D10 B1']
MKFFFKGSALVLLLQTNVVFSQQSKEVTHQQLIWYGYNTTVSFSANWYLVSEVQERHFIDPLAQHQLLFRTELHRNLGKEWNTSVGMTVFLQSPNDPESTSNLIVPELRPNIEFVYKQKLSFGILSHRYKAEARYFHNTANGELTTGYTFGNFRFRYQIGLEIPILKSKQQQRDLLSVRVMDEVHFNTGGNIVKNVFDQNRVYLALNYKITPKLSIEAGYLNWYQQRASGYEFYNRDIIRFTVFHKIDFKNNNKH